MSGFDIQSTEYITFDIYYYYYRTLRRINATEHYEYDVNY